MNPHPNLLVFGAFAGLAALASFGVVAFPNAVRSALCLVLNFFVLAFLYFTLTAEALGITQIIVYTGAIMVLFLFVIMLLNLGGAKKLVHEKIDYKVPVGILLGLAMFSVIGAQLLPMLVNSMAPAVNSAQLQPGSFQSIGLVLFTDYVVPFEAISILLLVGVVGSILLAKRKI